MQFEKKKSISNIKYPIISYNFSNDPNFFVVSSQDRKIKCYKCFAGTNLEDSKIIAEIELDFEDETFLPIAENCNLYVIEKEKNEFEGIIACSYDTNIYIFGTNGKVFLFNFSFFNTLLRLMKRKLLR